MERRQVIGSGFAAAAGGLLTGTAREAEAAPAAEDTSQAAAAAVTELRQSLERQFEATNLGPSRSIDAIRNQQHQFLRANQKYPDFIEVGLGVWDDVYDWHVKHHQPITATRLADGRYGMTYMFTTLILRHDLMEDYVGFAFDVDAQGRRR